MLAEDSDCCSVGWAIDFLEARAVVHPRLEEIGIDWRVVAFYCAAVILTGVLIGIVPGWRASRSGTLKR